MYADYRKTAPSLFLLGSRLRGLIPLSLVMALALMPLAGQARTLQIQDYLDWEWVADPQLSPNGKTIVYTRKHVNRQEDRIDGELWIMDADGSRNRRLLKEAGAETAWSPDGSRIAYIAKTDQGREIFVRWMNNEGSVIQVTQGANQSSSLSWSPDGKFIAFRALVPSAPTWTIDLPGKPAGAKWAENATVVDTVHYRQDGVGLKPLGYQHIFVVPAQGGGAQQVTQGEWHVGAWSIGHDTGASLAWSPDGKFIVYSADKEPGADLVVARASIYRVDVATGKTNRITTTPEYAIRPKLSPNGQQIAYLGADKTMTTNFPDRELHVIGTDGANDRIVLANIPDSRPTFYWSPDGRGLYYIYGKEGAHNLHYVSLSGKTKEITSGAQSLSLSSISKQGIAVGTRTTAQQPGDIVRFDLATGRHLQQLTAVNEDVLADIELGRVEEIWYQSTENTSVQGWIVYPPDFNPDKKYPLILDIHGGPEMMYTGDWRISPIAFSWQEWAARGYVVLYTNPRGSTGYSGEFARAIYNAYPGERDYQDLMHGVDAVVERGFIDEDRLYVQGCSGGGILTAWVVTQTDRFAGAAALCPTVNTISKTGASDIPVWNYNRFKNYFWDDATDWLEHSAIMYADKIKTPTLVMVGENDLRTTVSQPNELYTALKMLGVPTKLILLKDESHATWQYSLVGRPSNFMRAQLYLHKWFGEWQRVEAE